MATANTAGMQQRQPSRWGRNLAILALVIAIAVTGWFWSRMRDSALASTAYAAQTGCLCHFAAGREMKACAADPAVAREWVSLSEEAAARTITASVPLLSRQTAHWTRDGGCTLEPWRE